MKWHDLAKYHQGQSPEGHDTFAVPIEPDDDGMIGRECPQEGCHPRYFKIVLSSDSPSTTDQNESPTLLFCPYCGTETDIKDYFTKAQKEYIFSMIRRDVYRNIQDVFKGVSSPTLTFKPSPLPSVRHYVEEKLQRITECDNCAGNYAVYGAATYCPFCGSGTIRQHLTRDTDIIVGFLDLRPELEAQKGNETGYYLLGNCLEDCVGLFEGFMKRLYSKALEKSVTEQQRQQKLKKVGNAFQNFSKAEKMLRAEFGVELFDNASASDRRFLELQFAKRHLITHNLSEVDERYLKQIQTGQDAGQQVELDDKEIRRVLILVGELLTNAMTNLPG